ncbi:hypothetical protein H310_12482 [Aphanomyces invadans]|uniref:Uncharacterized protein n=1 Tax=Aphanomyces invadans TaxID=157072 RepID=A0A024TI31_9STRA|nr:hypothetical protein H310_12482 [Aphanomyces invadans]ETV93718.1 hypothetical protein H310_12482 [Aphanomyces invadans]|eukprot:XP_008877759.1 hypothetical protein H310_12482 [Aphanomyces invadans]
MHTATVPLGPPIDTCTARRRPLAAEMTRTTFVLPCESSSRSGKPATNTSKLLNLEWDGRRRSSYASDSSVAMTTTKRSINSKDATTQFTFTLDNITIQRRRTQIDRVWSP